MTSRNIAASLSAEELEAATAADLAGPALGLKNPYAGLGLLGPSLGIPAPEVQMSEKIDEIATALSKAQGQLESAKKGTEGYGYNYSDLASVISTAKPVLSSNGLAIVQLTGNSGDKMQITTILTHSSGQYFKSVFAMSLVDMKGVNIAQKAGATLSYMRRYAYQSIIGMSSEDSDASSKGFSSGKKAAPKKEAKKEEPRFKRNTKKEEDDDGI